MAKIDFRRNSNRNKMWIKSIPLKSKFYKKNLYQEKTLLKQNVFFQVISTTMINSNTATSFLPFRTEFKDWNTSSTSSSSVLPSQATSRRSSSASLNSTAISTGTSQQPTAETAATPAEPTPVEPAPTNSVMAYFAAINRIRNGEGFRLLGRRVTPSGKVQYLIEWNGNGNTSLFWNGVAQTVFPFLYYSILYRIYLKLR